MQPPLPVALPPSPPGPATRGQIAAPPGRTTHGLRDVVKAVATIWGIEFVLFTAFAVVMAVRSEGKIDKSMALRLTPVDAAITLGASWLFACHKYRRPFREAFGLAGARQRTVLAAGLAGALAAIASGQLVSRGIGNTPTPMSEWVGKIASTSNGFLFLILAFPVIGAVEEIYYRGFVFPALAERWGAVVATVVTAAWFGLLHLPQLKGNWFALAYVASMGVFFTVLRARTGSTAPGLAAHMIYNATLPLGALIASLFK
jgi:membrane protease YdiL (CAAX protease family)